MYAPTRKKDNIGQVSPQQLIFSAACLAPALLGVEHCGNFKMTHYSGFKGESAGLKASEDLNPKIRRKP